MITTIERIPSVLTPDLLKPAFKHMADPENPTAGHCYHAAEAAYHLLGGQESGWKPRFFREDDGITHWWLVKDGEIIDPTADQYLSKGLTPPYESGKPCGFLTKQPSNRAQKILDRLAA